MKDINERNYLIQEINDNPIVDRGSLRKYRTEIPNIIFTMDLSVYEFTLYCYLKKVAGDQGKCFARNKALSKSTGISVRKLISCKNSLKEKGLITCTLRKTEEGDYDTTIIEIIDFWPTNFAYFADKKVMSNTQHGDGSLATPTAQPAYIKERTNIKKELKEEVFNIAQSSPEGLTEPKKDIFFDFETLKFVNIVSEDKVAWQIAYPNANIEQELAKMSEWLKANPSKARKKLWRKFITNWLNRVKLSQKDFVLEDIKVFLGEIEEALNPDQRYETYTGFVAAFCKGKPFAKFYYNNPQFKSDLIKYFNLVESDNE